jgi:glycosyltransferase involved in cell wall biosynthesis
MILANTGLVDRPPLRVLTVIDSLATGGAETLVCGATRALAARGDTNVALVVLYPDLSEAWRLKGSSVAVISLDMRGKRDLCRGARRLQREIAAFSPDVVHTHLFPADLVTALATRAKQADVPTVLSEHSESNRRRRLPLHRYLEGWVYGHYNHIVCVSTTVESALSACMPAIRGRTTVVPNAVEVPSDGWNARGPFATDLIFIGRLFKQKGLDILIDSMSLLRARGMHVSLKVVGEGPRRIEYERLVQRYELSDRIQFVGRRQDAQELMRRARALVMPSRFEGLSMVLLEAMSLGMPVIATAVSGASEVIDDGVSGYLVRPKDVVGLAEGIGVVLGDRTLASRIGQNARDTVEREFSMTYYAARLLRVYEKVRAAGPGSYDTYGWPV